MTALDLPLIATLVAAGLAAGVLNTFAGGGALLLVPSLMLTGMSATLANGTCRIAILAQCATSALAFARRGLMPTTAARSVVPPVVLGAAVGAVLATRLPDHLFEPLLLGTLGLMALLFLLDPGRLAPAPGTPPRPATGWAARLALLGAGLYGGVLQAGNGLIILAIVVGGLRHDLVRGNALKALVMLTYTVGAVLVFAFAGQIVWAPALVLAVGTSLGAAAATRIAMSSRGVVVTKVVVVAAVLGLGVAVLLR